MLVLRAFHPKVIDIRVWNLNRHATSQHDIKLAAMRSYHIIKPYDKNLPHSNTFSPALISSYYKHYSISSQSCSDNF